MEKRERAKEVAQYYFSRLARHAGMYWGHDNDSEIELLVDLIIDAAKEELQTGEDGTTTGLSDM
jgi:hypothetical protein